MTDSTEQSDGQTDELFKNNLGERLWKRGTEPPGVIDVRFGQQKYFRIVRWLARRTALVAHLRSRYGIDETQAYGEHPFAAQHRFGQQLNLFSTTIQSFSTTQSFPPAVQAATPDAPQNQTGWNRRPSSLAEIIAERSSKPATEKPAAEQADLPEKKFRISRRPPPMLLKSDAAPTVHPPAVTSHPSAITSDASLPSQSHTKTDTPRAESVSEAEPPSHVAHVNEAPVINEPPPDFVFRKSDAESSSVENTIEVTQTSAQRNPRMQEQTASAQEKPARVTSSGEQVGAASSIVERDHREIANASPPPLILVKPLASPPGSSPSVAGASSVEPLLLSQSADGARRSQSGDAAAQKDIGSSQVSSVDNSPVVAQEIRSDSFNTQRPDVVWRTSPGSSPSADFTAQKSGTPALSSVGESGRDASAATTQQSHQTGLTANVQTASPQAQSKEIQVEHISPQVIRAISERVMRTLTLDLKLERERRGGTKWR